MNQVIAKVIFYVAIVSMVMNSHLTWAKGALRFAPTVNGKMVQLVHLQFTFATL